jgi:hypothetical protein
MSCQGCRRKASAETETKNNNYNKVPKCTARWKFFILNEEAACNSVDHICKRRTEHENELHDDDCKIRITNQANHGITRIIFQIQKIVTLLSVTPTTKERKKERKKNQTAHTKCHRILMMVVISLQHTSKLANQVYRSMVL